MEEVLGPAVSMNLGKSLGTAGRIDGASSERRRMVNGSTHHQTFPPSVRSSVGAAAPARERRDVRPPEPALLGAGRDQGQHEHPDEPCGQAGQEPSTSGSLPPRWWLSDGAPPGQHGDREGCRCRQDEDLRAAVLPDR